MTFTVDIRGMADLQQDLADLIVAADVSATRVMNFVAQSTAQRAKNKVLSGPKSGRVYQTSRGAHQASAPGESPADFTGALVRSIRYTRATNSKDTASAGSNLYYAKTLEFGGFNDRGLYVESRPFLYPSFREAITSAAKQLKIEFMSKL